MGPGGTTQALNHGHKRPAFLEVALISKCAQRNAPGDKSIHSVKRFVSARYFSAVVLPRPIDLLFICCLPHVSAMPQNQRRSGTRMQPTP